MYEKLIELEEAAKGAKRGIHSNKARARARRPARRGPCRALSGALARGGKARSACRRGAASKTPPAPRRTPRRRGPTTCRRPATRRARSSTFPSSRAAGAWPRWWSTCCRGTGSRRGPGGGRVGGRGGWGGPGGGAGCGWRISWDAVARAGRPAARGAARPAAAAARPTPPPPPRPPPPHAQLHIPKEGVSIAFAPSGIKTPARAAPASNGRPAIAGEPFADEALAFTRDNFMQREVEVEVEGMDKGGTFLGAVVTVGPKPINLGPALVSQVRLLVAGRGGGMRPPLPRAPRTRRRPGRGRGRRGRGRAGGPLRPAVRAHAAPPPRRASRGCSPSFRWTACAAARSSRPRSRRRSRRTSRWAGPPWARGAAALCGAARSPLQSGCAYSLDQTMPRPPAQIWETWTPEDDAAAADGADDGAAAGGAPSGGGEVLSAAVTEVASAGEFFLQARPRGGGGGGGGLRRRARVPLPRAGGPAGRPRPGRGPARGRQTHPGRKPLPPTASPQHPPTPRRPRTSHASRGWRSSSRASSSARATRRRRRPRPRSAPAASRWGPSRSPSLRWTANGTAPTWRRRGGGGWGGWGVFCWRWLWRWRRRRRWWRARGGVAALHSRCRRLDCVGEGGAGPLQRGLQRPNKHCNNKRHKRYDPGAGAPGRAAL